MPFNKERFLNAAKTGDIATLEAELRETDANPTASDDNQCTGLIYAALNGQTAAAELLMRNNTFLGYTTIKPKTTALLAAINNGHREIVQILLKQDKNIAIDAKDDEGNTALHLALQKGDQELAKMLIARGADPSIANNAKQVPATNPFLEEYLKQHFCPSIFIKAAEQGDLATLQAEAVKQDFNVNAVNTSGDFALIRAAYNGHETVVDFLIQKNVKVNQQAFDGYTAIKLAAERNKPQIVRRLVATDADRESQYQALKQSIINGWSPETAKYLINEVGLDVNHAYSSGNSSIPLMYWIFWGGEKLPSKELLTLLLQKGAKDEDLALKQAAQLNDREYIEIVLNHGADVNKADPESGYTALMCAAQNRNLENVHYLLAEGADPFAKNKKGETAFDLVSVENYQTFKEKKKASTSIEVCQQYQASLAIQEVLLQAKLKRKKSWRHWEIAGAVVSSFIGILSAGFAAVNYFGLSTWLGSTVAGFIATLSMPLWINFALLGVGVLLLTTAIGLGIAAIVNKISSNTLEKQLVPINSFNEELFIDVLTFRSADKEQMWQRRVVLHKQLHYAKHQPGGWQCRDIQEDKFRFSPLVYAARMGDDQTVAGLLNAGADIESDDGHRNTALAYAVTCKHEDVVKLLLQREAIIDANVERLAAKSSPAIQRFLQDEKIKRATPAEIVNAPAYRFGYQQPASAGASDKQALLANNPSVQP